ncbi:MAG: hybrid sensor histidine kinase/response regulator [Anaerolineae bacterium]|nr:hybrid sensor histidine kinase/response regulator [Anaerolineae bacterium]
MARIIIIEDEAGIRSEVAEWLQFEGYEVDDAANGRRGLETIYQHAPDLILCDIAMPEMDGHEVLINVRADPALTHIPFIFLTAAADRDTLRKGMNLGADDYLTKPFTHAEVIGAVRSRLEKKAAQDKPLQDYLSELNSALSEEREQRLLKSRLVGMFSHDFRLPLTSILACSGILRNYADRLTHERKLEQLDRIDGAVHMLIQMLDDMLLITQMDQGHLSIVSEPIDLVSLIQTLVEEFRLIDRSAHSFSIHHTNPPEIEADPRLMRQALTNLLGNALKYSPAETEISIRLEENQGQLVLSIQDHGIGVPPENLSTLFEPFERASNARHIKGTGLGLAIVRECVEQHSGQVWLESQLGQGTTFFVALPTRQPPA